ncbi:D-2-hydroxyacid dehydrogenase [Spirochaeta cellobiosiphila]|uniref:D-2-hydroxyacid dehydrogenase n=1 Tax=Spirochaeta cellobiosiphila TaxID=504483 RepID=UPI00048E5EFE|nr:D-2-hydroxyacid dehydrogenase [Spirochaeta cellobiosiphila]
MKNIVVLDGITMGDDIDFTSLEKLGQVTIHRMTEEEQIIDRCIDAQIIITNKVFIREYHFRSLPQLELICLTATGYNNIDIESARKHHVSIANVSGYSTNAVAQHTFAMLFYLWERSRYFDDYTRSGDYCNSEIFTHLSRKFYELSGKTWGIVGLGAIGKKVAQIAKAFGCNIIYYSTSGKNSNQEYTKVDLKTLLHNSDVISIHSPLNDRTKDLFTLRELQQMKSTSYIINVGRGGIINEEDLVEALNLNLIAAACIDVLTTEPMAISSPYRNIINKDKLYITPHVAWAPIETRQRVIEEVTLNIQAFLSNEKRNIVN